jgi:hypothetical protein
MIEVEQADFAALGGGLLDRRQSLKVLVKTWFIGLDPRPNPGRAGGKDARASNW